jgi:hypothetical protein
MDKLWRKGIPKLKLLFFSAAAGFASLSRSAAQRLFMYRASF